MTAPACQTCDAPFFFEGNIGAKSISVNKVCNCGSVEVEPMPDVINQLTTVREFLAILC